MNHGPQFNEKFLIEETFECPVSFNGKMRFKIELPVNLPQDEVKKIVLSDERAQKWIGEGTPKSDSGAKQNCQYCSLIMCINKINIFFVFTVMLFIASCDRKTNYVPVNELEPADTVLPDTISQLYTAIYYLAYR